MVDNDEKAIAIDHYFICFNFCDGGTGQQG